MFHSGSGRFVTRVCDETAGWEQRGGEASSTSERQADECEDAEHDGSLRESGQRVSGCGGVGRAAEVSHSRFKRVCINPRWSGLSSSGSALSRTGMSS